MNTELETNLDNIGIDLSGFCTVPFAPKQVSRHEKLHKRLRLFVQELFSM